MKYTRGVLLLLIHFFSNNPFSKPLAVTIVPVADLVGESFQDLFKTNHPLTYYQQLPLSGVTVHDCHRIYQALYNEVVTILETKKDEVLVQLSHASFQKEHETSWHNKYWSLKTNFITLEELQKKNVDISTIPPQLTPQTMKHHKSTYATLIEPFYDVISNRTFSAGTRFIIYKSEPNSIVVSALHPENFTHYTMQLPRKICFIDNSSYTKQARINIFLNLLERWANQEHGFIEYVWGGSSFTHRRHNDQFTIINKNNCSFYCRDNAIIPVKTGFDCTGLIIRAAQICGIPYFYKNTITSAQNLELLTAKHAIRNGDLLWFPWHILVISDIENNMLIEARAYEHGFGKIHELPISKVFKNITTIDQLVQRYFNHEPLERLHKDGTVVQNINTFKILRLLSVWHSPVPH